MKITFQDFKFIACLLIGLVIYLFVIKAAESYRESLDSTTGMISWVEKRYGKKATEYVFCHNGQMYKGTDYTYRYNETYLTGGGVGQTFKVFFPPGKPEESFMNDDYPISYPELSKVECVIDYVKARFAEDNPGMKLTFPIWTLR